MNSLRSTQKSTNQSLVILQKIGFAALMGLATGIFFEHLMSFLLHGQYSPGVPSFIGSFDNSNTAVLIERCVYVGLGLLLGLLGQLFERDHISLTLATVLHFLGVNVVLLGAGLYLHWVNWGWLVLGFIIITSVIYFCIWGVIWLSVRSQITKANQKLAARRNH